MIVGIGTDIVRIDRIQHNIEINERFAERIYTQLEIEYCKSKASLYQSFAVRFAAKEAMMKALGTGWDGKVNWTDIEILNTESGKPMINLTGGALNQYRKLGIKEAHISLSHEREYAIAYVVLES